MQRVAMKELIPERTSSKPLVFRLDGTNVDQVPGFSRSAGRLWLCLWPLSLRQPRRL